MYTLLGSACICMYTVFRPPTAANGEDGRIFFCTAVDLRPTFCNGQKRENGRSCLSASGESICFHSAGLPFSIFARLLVLPPPFFSLSSLLSLLLSPSDTKTYMRNIHIVQQVPRTGAYSTLLADSRMSERKFNLRK